VTSERPLRSQCSTRPPGPAPALGLVEVADQYSGPVLARVLVWGVDLAGAPDRISLAWEIPGVAPWRIQKIRCRLPGHGPRSGNPGGRLGFFFVNRDPGVIRCHSLSWMSGSPGPTSGLPALEILRVHPGQMGSEPPATETPNHRATSPEISGILFWSSGPCSVCSSYEKFPGAGERPVHRQDRPAPG
jgi:hypothetical protein